MKKVASKTRQLLTRKVLRRVFLIAAFLGVADTLISAVGWTYLGRLSPAILLSDLLFLEGSAFLAVGIFFAVSRTWRGPQHETDESTDENENDASPHFSIQMMIVGAVLIALAVGVGTLSPLIR